MDVVVVVVIVLVNDYNMALQCSLQTFHR